MLRGRVFDAGHPAVMAIVNRTDDSFFAGNRHADLDSAMRALDQAVDEGADIVDVGGVRAGQEGEPVSAAAGDRPGAAVPRTGPSRIPRPRASSLDTWRSEVAAGRRAVMGVDLVNDTWAGHDPELVRVAAELGAGVVVSHTGGLPPRTDPVDVSYGPDPLDVVRDVVETLARGADGSPRGRGAAGAHPRRPHP